MIPTTWKRTWRGRQLAMQKRVVAFGERAVGQWMEDGGAGVVEEQGNGASMSAS